MATGQPIYLDYNATTPVLPEVVDAMLPYLREHFGNPSSDHVYGQRAREAVARARGQVAALLGCDADEVVFTGGGTEANNLAIRGVAEARAERRHVVTSVIEHPATAGPCDWLERHGWTVTRIAVDADGRMRVADARAAIGDGTALVSVMHSNNETGVLQPVDEIAAVARDCGALVHTDAAQSRGQSSPRRAGAGRRPAVDCRPQAVCAQGCRRPVRQAGHAARAVHARGGTRAWHPPWDRERRVDRRPGRRLRNGRTATSNPSLRNCVADGIRSGTNCVLACPA